MSKGLEALKELTMWATNSYMAMREDDEKRLIPVIENELKALEIIKEKLGNRITLQRFFKGYVLILNDGDTIIDLTQEEYDLLKEVLL